MFEKARAHVLVIALQMNGLEAWQGFILEKLDDPATIRPPVEIVAEIDQDLSGLGGHSRDILQDSPMEVAQEIQAAMNIADSVNTNTARNPRGGKRRLSRKRPDHSLLDLLPL